MRYNIENLNAANKAGVVGLSGWNDPDFLFMGGQECQALNEAGSGAHCQVQTDQYYRMAFSMWAIGFEPSIVVVEVANMTKVLAETLLNLVTAMHQRPLASIGKRVATDPSCVHHSPPEKPTPGTTNPVDI